ncbi:Josephin-domain-containing protein [Auricularia subglabra TFB-10046 SS5]|nr:Josephin-domain-containing protein [Auricularia subglabra TFB-10046 SS5]
MAGLEPLIPHIYHERQQPGSMLCAQHALNSLLQGNYFTAPDLAEIARNLDALEQSVHEERVDRQSTNMDDTGFFSVQVLEEALKVWGLRLVRWRSEEMIAFQDRPTTQLAFILNLELHWFTLRRFGPAKPNPYEDPGDGHWFNLNSFLEAPEWISHTYLGMVLQQAEQEGYSVFAVCQVDPTAELTLARTEADALAGTLPQPTSAGTSRLNTARIRQANAASSSSGHVEGAEDEDLMLQAALQASLMGDEAFAGEGGEIPAWLRDQDFSAFDRGGPARDPDFSQFRHAQNLVGPSAGEMDVDDGEGGEGGADPVAASIARNRALMDRMRREQQFAMRGAIDDDIRQHIQRARFPNAQPEPGPQPQADDDDDSEDAQLQATLAASRHHIVFDTPPRQNRFSELADEDEAPLPAPRPAANQRHVVYDDDDAELQAALRASLEGLPEGFMMPPSPQPRALPPSRLDQAVAAPSSSRLNQPAPAPVQQAGKRKADDEADEEELPAQEELSPEEMRRRRLARFS